MGGGIELIPPLPARLAENTGYIFMQFASHRTHLSRGARELRFASAEDTSGVWLIRCRSPPTQDRRLTPNQRCVSRQAGISAEGSRCAHAL